VDAKEAIQCGADHLCAETWSARRDLHQGRRDKLAGRVKYQPERMVNVLRQDRSGGVQNSEGAGPCPNLVEKSPAGFGQSTGAQLL